MTEAELKEAARIEVWRAEKPCTLSTDTDMRVIPKGHIVIELGPMAACALRAAIRVASEAGVAANRRHVAELYGDNAVDIIHKYIGGFGPVPNLLFEAVYNASRLVNAKSLFPPTVPEKIGCRKVEYSKDGIRAIGGTGEPYTLSLAQLEAMVERCKAASNGERMEHGD